MALLRVAIAILALFASPACAGTDAAHDQELEDWFTAGCGEVLLWARALPTLPEVAPTVGGLQPAPVVRFAEELSSGADSLILRLESLGPPGDESGDLLYAGLLAELSDVSTQGTALADQYRAAAAIPLTELDPIIRQATDLSAGVATAFRSFGRDPDVGPVVLDIESCQAVGQILS
jgi:hypothetical protein